MAPLFSITLRTRRRVPNLPRGARSGKARPPATRIRSALAPLALATFLAQACSLSVEAKVPDVEVTQHGVRFDGVPHSVSLTDVSLSSGYTLSSENLAWAKSLNSQIYAMKVTLQAAGNLDDLSFIHAALVTMSDASGAGAPTDVIDYQAPEVTEPCPTLEVDTKSALDVTQLWQAKQTRIEVKIAGFLPEQPWTVDVTIQLGGKITYKY
jgi:hypothetical protein